MALVSCPDCGNQMSTEAAACARCGRPGQRTTDAERQKQQGSALVVVVMLAACAGVFLWVRGSWQDHQQKEAQAAAAAAAAPCYVYWRDIAREGAAAPTSPPLFPTEEAALLFQAAIGRKDEATAGEILRIAPTIPPGSRAEVIERKPAMRHVRVAGQTGWVLDDTCHAAPPR